MGISNVAVDTFDSSGSQSLCRTNEYIGDEEVKSSFISKCQKMYISGSGETVIPGSLRTFPTTKSVDTFNINSDTDAISDITLNIEFKLKRQTPSTGLGAITVTVAGTGYTEGETLWLTHTGGNTNATATAATTTAAGGVSDIIITNPGSGYSADSVVYFIGGGSNVTASGTCSLLPGDWNANVSKDIILGLIDKVEIKLGSLTVQTITADDIYIRNLTELGQPFTFSAPFENAIKARTTLAVHRPLVEYNVWKHHGTDGTADLVIQAACSIPFIGRSKDMSRSLLQAGALTNSVTAKVYYNNIYTSNTTPGDSHYQILSAGDAAGEPDPAASTPSAIGTSGEFLDPSYFKSFITVKTHIISETEKNFISKNIIHKVLNTSTNVTKDITKILDVTTSTEGVTDVEVDLENVSLNVSHLLIGIRLPHVHNEKLNVKYIPNVPPHNIDLVSHTLDNQLSTPFSVIDSQTFNDPIWRRPDNLLGYMPNAIESMELVIGSDRTGFIKGASAKIGGCENFTLLNSDKNSAHYIVTLAEKAFDTSGIPFSKCNNKKLLIKLNKHIFKTVGVRPNPLSNATYTQNAIITVTACGTKVQTVVGGSMSFM